MEGRGRERVQQQPWRTWGREKVQQPWRAGGHEKVQQQSWRAGGREKVQQQSWKAVREGSQGGQGACEMSGWGAGSETGALAAS